MLTRRFLRVKAFKILFSYAYSDNDSLLHAEKDLRASLEKTYDLYHYLLSAIIAVADYAEERIEIGLRKFKPSEAEANPNKKFINNKVIATLRENTALQKYNAKQHLNWREHADVIKQIYTNMTERPYYKDYMSSTNDSFYEELRLVEDFFRSEFEDNELIESMIEEMNAYWADDIGFVLISIIRTINALRQERDTENILMPMFRAPDDEEYVFELLRYSLAHFKDHSQLAHQYVQNWESDRIAFVDMALIVMGISEALAFPSIPVKVTINEYVEIAKYYSTRNSHVFVNGVLDKVIQNLLHEGAIKKSGRGLIEETIIKKPNNKNKYSL
ncbi:MAG: transcription antitermination protein NusB [Prevotellaceae bacterium]|jgi:N utilization substance protein B|nr:transcription antitermination protein NusB [Prevotellaceae bacterium]